MAARALQLPGRARGMPFDLTPTQALFFVILLVAAALLVTERLRTDAVALLIILALGVTGILKPEEALGGFGSEPAIVIASMFVLSAGFQQTGLADTMGGLIGRLAGRGQTRMVAVLTGAAALLSSFAHHVTITAVMLPVTLGLARDREIPPSRLLMPMAIGSSLGTTITGLGAPSFLVARELLRQAGRPTLGIAEIAPFGVAVTVAGLLFMVLVGRFLLPSRRGAADTTSHFRLASYFTELAIPENSHLAGKTLEGLRADLGQSFAVVGWLRQGQRLDAPHLNRLIDGGDVLLVRATPEALIAIREDEGAELRPVLEYQDRDGAGGPSPRGHDDKDLHETLVQAVVAPNSVLAGRSVGDVDFRRRYGVLVLGLWRKRSFVSDELSRVRLHAGDVLVLQGNEDAVAAVAADQAFLMLVPFHGERKNPRRARMAAIVMGATVALAALGWVSLGLAALAGALAMVLFRCLTPRQAYRAVDAPMFLFVAGAIPLGKAMQETGAARVLAGGLQGLVGGWPPVLVLLALFTLVGVVVQFMGSDSATTALFGPLAIALAQTLGRAPEPYVVAVLMAAVTAVLTPMVHHNLLIYGPGGYRFTDYTRVGAPLTAVLALVVCFLAITIWPA